MPFQTPPTFADGEILDASRLNVLSDDIEYLYGLVTGISFPFTGIKGNGEIDNGTVAYYQFHAHRYLVHRLDTDENLGSDLDNNVEYLVNWGDHSSDHLIYAGTTGTSQSGTIDLYDPESWPNWIGAWASATAYEQAVSPNYNTGIEDGEIVSNGGNYYKCIQDHTSGTAFGTVGVHWVQITNPTVGELYRFTLDLNFDAGVANRSHELQYIYEAS